MREGSGPLWPRRAVWASSLLQCPRLLGTGSGILRAECAVSSSGTFRLAVVTAVAFAAGESTVSDDGKSIVFRTGSAPVTFAITTVGGDHKVVASAGAINAGKGCKEDPVNTVTCPNPRAGADSRRRRRRPHHLDRRASA